MAETSRPWAGTTPGDAGPYSNEHWTEVWGTMFVQDRSTQGVIVGVGGELAPAGVVSPIAIDDGAAMVDGAFYVNDTPVSIAIPTPVSSTRIDLIVLRKSWSAQTVRITRLAGTEGSGPPSLTQVDGVTWDIPLAEVSINTDGDVSIDTTASFVASPLLASLVSFAGGLLEFGTIGNRQRLTRDGPLIVGVDDTWTVQVSIGDGENVISTTPAVKGWVAIPRNCQILGYTLGADVVGSIVVDVWRTNYASFPANNSQSITGSEKPTLSSAIKAENMTISSWNVDCTKGDWLFFEVESASTVKQITLVLWML